MYVKRLQSYVSAELAVYRSQEALLDGCDRLQGRMLPLVILLDSRGKSLSSSALAKWMGEARDAGRQSMIFAVGPADGWSENALRRGDQILSFGPMTLPHELARLVLAEQIYRAFTILAGHPYHSGH